MKFLSSLIGGIFLSIILMLLLGFILKCDHTNIIAVYSIQPEKSSAMSYVKSKCAECKQTVGSTSFSEESYTDAIKEHCEDKTFIRGEYDTVKATVVLPDYDYDRTRIICKVRQDAVEVNFTVEFKEEYEEAVSLLQSGDEITFYGRSASKGLFFADCELIVE